MKQKRISQELQVILVLKSGGDFKPNHVTRLTEQIKKNLTVPHKLFCLTDYPGDAIEEIEIIPLLDKLPGWWSKIEIFRTFTNVLYFDLDTTILRNIDFLAQFKPNFGALLSKHRNMGSGIMRWYGDFSGLYKYFKAHSDPIMQYFSWEQEYINSWLINNAYKVEYIQHHFPGRLMSYKNDYLPMIEKKSKPKPSIIYFHGKPRPWDIKEII